MVLSPESKTVQRQRRFDGSGCPPWICAVYCPIWNSRRRGQMMKALLAWPRNICSNEDSGILHIADSTARITQMLAGNGLSEESLRQVFNLPCLKTPRVHAMATPWRMKNTA